MRSIHQIFMTVLFLCVCSAGVRGQNGPIRFALTLKNETNAPVTVRIPRGEIFECVNSVNNPQNIVVNRDYTFRLPAQTRQTVNLTGFCTNRTHGAPRNEPVRPTPFQLNRPFETQADVWRHFQSLASQ